MSMGGHKKVLGGMFGKESTNYNVDLNVTPLMDVMSNILFFLLASFGATVVAILPTTVPVKSSEISPQAPPEEDKVDVSLKADDKGLAITAQSPHIDPSALREFSIKLPKK